MIPRHGPLPARNPVDSKAARPGSRFAIRPCPPYAPATMKFLLVDSVIEQTGERIVAQKQVSLAEEYLGDHFPGFPVLPGVMMLEAMTQAARAMLAGRGDPRLVLGEVRALSFRNMVRPGEVLTVEVTLAKELDDGAFLCKGVGRVTRRQRDEGEGKGEAGRQLAADGETAVSGRFTMRPARPGRPADVGAA